MQIQLRLDAGCYSSNSNTTATRIVIGIMASDAISRLCKHSFNVCSDLPKLNPIFSCSACDLWRERVHSVHYKDRSSLDRSKLSSKCECERKKEDMVVFASVLVLILKRVLRKRKKQFPKLKNVRDIGGCKVAGS